MNRQRKQRQFAQSAPGFLSRCLHSRITWVALTILLVSASFGAYRVGRQIWAKSHFREAEAALERRDFAGARRHLDRYLDVWPDDLPVRLLAARTARRQGDFEDADRRLRAYLAEGGSRKDVEIERRLGRLQLGAVDEGAGILRYCVDHPQGAESYLFLEALIEGSFQAGLPAMMLDMSNQGRSFSLDVSIAQRAVDLWLERFPGQTDQVQGLVWRGQFHALAREYPQARTAWTKALDLDPEHFQVRKHLAEALVPETPAEAVPHFETLLERQPDNNAIRLRLAEVQRILGHADLAASLLDDILAVDPDHVGALIERGKVALDARQLDAAGRWLGQAVKLDFNNLEANLALSRCLHEAGNDSEAKIYQGRYDQIKAEQKRQKDEWVKMQSQRNKPPGQ